MMKTYLSPMAELLNINSTDVIATSLTANAEYSGFGADDNNAWDWS
mgnify:CR=1 FL=1